MRNKFMTEQQIIQKAQHLIAIPSTVDNLPALQDAIGVITDMLATDPDITVEHFSDKGVPSLLAYKGNERPSRFAVLLNGHLDVVPGKPAQFMPYIKDGKLFGRGAHDMKTAAIIMTDVFLRMVHRVKYPLGLQIVCDEETGGFNGTKIQINQGVRTDFAIMGEHSFQKNAIYNAARGLCWIDAVFTGKTAHGGYVWNGNNAVMQASNFAQALLEQYPIPETEIWGTTVNVASLHAEHTVYNRVPDTATLRLDFRFTPEDANFRDRQSVRAFLRSIDPRADITFRLLEHAIEVSPANPYLEALAAAVQHETKQEPIFSRRYAGGDARHYTRVGGNCVEYGLMGNGPHSDNEYVELSDITRYKQTLESFLQRAIPVAEKRSLVTKSALV
jgi:succinyl-diaminopimelate desuccinylase